MLGSSTLSSQALSARVNLRASSAPGRTSAARSRALHNRQHGNSNTTKTKSVSCVAAGGAAVVPFVDVPTSGSYILLKPGYPLKWMDSWVNHSFSQLPRTGGLKKALTEKLQEGKFALRSKVANAPTVDADAAKTLLEREGYALLDLRSAKAFEEKKHIVEPANRSFNVPCMGIPGAVFVDGVGSHFSKASKILVVDESGKFNKVAADALARSGYKNVKSMEGGFEGWTGRFSKSTGSSSGGAAMSHEDEESELTHENLWTLDMGIDGLLLG